MAYYKRTNIFKNILFSRGMALAIIFAIIFMGYAVFSVAGKSIKASEARKQTEIKAAQLKEKELGMSTKLTALQTADGQEAALREQFPVVRPGERVVVITDAEPASLQSASVIEAEASGGFWLFFKGLFGKE